MIGTIVPVTEIPHSLLLYVPIAREVISFLRPVGGIVELDKFNHTIVKIIVIAVIVVKLRRALDLALCVIYIT